MPHDIAKDIPVKELVKRFRDKERFFALCKECNNFGRQWSCPPLETSHEKELERWETATIIATVIEVPEGTPVEAASSLMQPEKIRIANQLLQREKTNGGRASTTIGRCLGCPEGKCARLDGLPCRHPELVRPSLEALGFNIADILDQLFGITLQWGSNGICPERLHLVTAHFH